MKDVFSNCTLSGFIFIFLPLQEYQLSPHSSSDGLSQLLVPQALTINNPASFNGNSYSSQCVASIGNCKTGPSTLQMFPARGRTGSGKVISGGESNSSQSTEQQIPLLQAELSPLSNLNNR